jgi:hypothetical protein
MNNNTMPAAHFRSEGFIRDWSAHWGFRLRRRGTGYSLYITYDNPDFPYPRVDCRTLGQVSQWLEKWGDEELARLNRYASRGSKFVLEAKLK